jgi:cbb3-type cytochrome oxidase subunit 3
MRMGQVYRKQNKNKIKAQFSTNLILKDQIEKKKQKTTQVNMN